MPRAIPPVISAPVDVPAIEESTVEKLVRGWSGELLRIPRYGGRRGHPVLVARALIGEFLALPPGAEARTVVLSPGALAQPPTH